MPPVGGCRCPACWTLREAMEQMTGKKYPGLPEAPGHLTLSVVTMPAGLAEPACDGSMVCQCPACTAERAERVRVGVRPSVGLPVKRAA